MSEIYNESNAKFVKVPNSLFYIGRMSDDKPSNPLLHHCHDCYELYYLYKGERYYFIQDKTYHVTGGSFVLINPYEIHSTGNLGNHGYDRMLIHFNKDFIDNYVKIDNINPYYNLDNEIHVISLDSQEQIFVEKLLKIMEMEYNNEFKENAHIKFALIELLLFLNKCKPSINDEAINKITQTQKIIFEIVGYINNNYFEDITLELLANKFYLDRFYISHAFKENTGLNFTEYLNNVRIKESKKMLINSNDSIEKISSIVGYRSSTHFGRVFKKIIGITPTEFRRNIK